MDAQQHNIKSRYLNREPMAAARKAARILFKKFGKKAGDKLYLQLRETTRGAKDATFFYEAKRLKVDKKRKVGGKEIKITQEISVKSVEPKSIMSKLKGGSNDPGKYNPLWYAEEESEEDGPRPGDTDYYEDTDSDE